MKNIEIKDILKVINDDINWHKENRPIFVGSDREAEMFLVGMTQAYFLVEQISKGE